MQYYTLLLEGIGAISSSDSKKAALQAGNYQDTVMEPVSREYENHAVGKYDGEEDEDGVVPCGILSGVEKDYYNLLTLLYITLQLRKTIRAIRVSPGRKKSWLEQVSMSHDSQDGILQSSELQRPLVLILDVKT
jgi:hypothetical protein